MDIVPYVLRICAPKLRCVTAELLTPLEKARLTGLISTLIGCGLTYAKSRQANNALALGGQQQQQQQQQPWSLSEDAEYVLEPAIDQLVHFQEQELHYTPLPGPLRSVLTWI